MPDYSLKIYRPPTLEEVKGVLGEDLSDVGALEGLDELEADWIRSHAMIAVYGHYAEIAPYAYCEAIGCERYTTTTFAFCKDCYFQLPNNLKMRLESGWKHIRKEIDCKLFYQATLYDCVLSIAETLDRTNPQNIKLIRNFEARRRVVRGELHRHFEALKPTPPPKPKLYIEYAPKPGKRNFLAYVSFKTALIDACSGAIVSAIPFTTTFLHRAKKEGKDSEYIRSKAAERYANSLAKGNLRPVHLDKREVPVGLRAFDKNAYYVSGTCQNGVCVKDGDVIVVEVLKGYEDVRYEYELASFLVWAGWDVFVDGDGFTLEYEYAADFYYRGRAVKGKSYRERPAEEE